ncbi:MAG: cbb3-type cytochrome oxidase assembly protein [Anaerolineae bacterium]
MYLGVWAFIGWMAFVTVSSLILLIWGWRTGQFKDLEKTSLRILEDREPQPWPGREEHKK